MSWVIISPAWGNHIDLLNGPGFKSIKEALQGRDFRLIVHTDEPNRINVPCETYPLINGYKPYGMMNNCMNHGLSLCKDGDYVAFINPDLVVSKEVFKVSEEQFKLGKTLVMCPSIRATKSPEPMDAESLLRFSIDNMHQLTKESFLGEGSKVGSIVLFKENDSIVMRCFHPHPFAIVKSGEINLERTVDFQLINNRPLDEIYISQNKEMALCEVSPPEKVSGNPVLNKFNLQRFIELKTTPSQRWAAKHRISIIGNPENVTKDSLIDELINVA